jgi:hypothetical protein
MVFDVRRSEIADIDGIRNLFKGGFGRDDMERALVRRYGENFNLQEIMYVFLTK